MSRARLVARLGLGSLAVVAVLLALGMRRDLPAAEVERLYGGPPSRFVTVSGQRLHVRDEGQGPPLVLIHGTSSSLHTWDGWVARLSARHRIVRLDLPGFGLTGPAVDGDYSAARYADLVDGLADALGLGAVDVAGNSLGGRVALELARRHPARVRRLVLVDAAGLSGHTPPPIFRLVRTPVLGELVRFVSPRFMVRKNVEQVYGDPSKVTDALVDRYDTLLHREGNRDALVDRLRGPTDPPLDDALAGITARTCVLWGGRDVWIPPAFGRRLVAGLPNATLHPFPRLGHVPMEEDPAGTAAIAQLCIEMP